MRDNGLIDFTYEAFFVVQILHPGLGCSKAEVPCCMFLLLGQDFGRWGNLDLSFIMFGRSCEVHLYYEPK